MRLVALNDAGALELRWTWLPYWLAVGPSLHNEIEATMRDVITMNGLPPTEASLRSIEGFVIKLIARRFQIEGLGDYLAALRFVREPD